MLPNKTQIGNSDSLIKFLLHFGFLACGIVTVLIGQILPILSVRLSINDAQAGYFFIAQFSGSLIGTFLTPALVKRVGFGSATAFGFLAMTIGILGLNSNDWLICLAAFVVMGLGIGITLPSINMLTVELNPLKITAALNFLNFFWGVGAIFCKPFIDVFGTPTSLFRPTFILAFLLFINGLTIFFAARQSEPRASFATGTTNESGTPIWATPIAWLITIFNFIHVGFESGMSGWITTYAARLPNQNSEIFGLSPTFAYFLFFVSGRLAAPLYSRFLDENKMLLFSLLTTTCGVIVLLVAESLGILVLGAAIAGLGTSTIFPTNMARFTKTFGSTATRRATPLFISGTLGAALTTWLIGVVSTNYQGLRFGMIVLLGSCLLLVCLQVYLSARSRTTVST